MVERIVVTGTDIDLTTDVFDTILDCLEGDEEGVERRTIVSVRKSKMMRRITGKRNRILD